MAEAAKALGYEYLAISDHSRHATVARGLDPKRLSAQLDEIDRLNEQVGSFRLFKSYEVDILADGKLDLPDRILRRLHFMVCAVHYRFDLDIDEQTRRILQAMDNRSSARRAPRLRRGSRPVIEGAKERGCFLEINAHPTRLDLDDIHARQAKEAGVKVSIATDAHSTVGLNAMRYGVDQARRGWIEAENVLNTRSWYQLKPIFSR